MRAFCTIRPGPLYRSEAFLEGLKAAGLQVFRGPPPVLEQCDVLVTWNRYGANHQLACEVERRGAVVLVAENGYMGFGGTSPKFDVLTGPQPGHYYALARGGHNGQGAWPAGDSIRWARLGIELKAWRDGDGHVLVLPNRPFGIPGQMMPEAWANEVVARLRGCTRRRVVVRTHPGNDRPQRPLSADLDGAAVAVIWSSSAGLHALAAGIPVICEAPAWICRAATSADLALVDNAPRPDRLPAFERMAWAQWTLEEIATGEPFRRLLA